MGAKHRIKPEKLAEKLLNIRLVLNLTMEKLAEKLEKPPKIKLHRATIYNYENGKREPPLPVLLRYAKLANIYVEYLIDDELKLPKNLPCSGIRNINMDSSEENN